MKCASKREDSYKINISFNINEYINQAGIDVISKIIKNVFEISNVDVSDYKIEETKMNE